MGEGSVDGSRPECASEKWSSESEDSTASMQTNVKTNKSYEILAVYYVCKFDLLKFILTLKFMCAWVINTSPCRRF